MGSIRTKKSKDGTPRYYAEIRINKNDTKFSESKTLSTKTLAKSWLRQRELELESNPSLLQKSQQKSMTFGNLAKLYLDSTHGKFARSWVSTILMLSKIPIASLTVDKMTAADFNEFAHARLNGHYTGYRPIGSSTLKNNMLTIKGLLHFGESLGLDVPLADFEKSMQGLSRTRQSAASNKRNRLPTSDELIRLTRYFQDKYGRRAVAVPMHLIIWFAIYSARRQDELTRLRLLDFDGEWWQLHDVKNPKGSRGNHKSFLVNDNAKRLIPYFTDPILRQNQRTMVKNYDDDLLIPASSKTISRFFTEGCKLLGIKDLHFHDLRHEACTRYAEQGLTIPQIQAHSLHENWGSLQRYVNIRPRTAVIDYWDMIDEKNE